MTQTANPLFNSLAGFMEEIEGEKQASAKQAMACAKCGGNISGGKCSKCGNMYKKSAEKQAEPTPSDPGGYQGPTTHPVKSVDNSGAPEQTGARHAENATDIKEDQPNVGVDEHPENSTGDGEQDSQQLNIGTNQSSVGEDPATEDRYKSTKDDPGTSHPSKSDDGQKYASATFEKASGEVERLSNEILADFANGLGFGSKFAAEGAGMPASPMNAKDPGDGGYSDGSMDYGSGEGGPDKTSMPGVSKDKKISEAPSTNDMAHSKGAAANMAAAAQMGQQLHDGNGHAKSAAEAGYQLAAMLGMEKMSAEERAQATIEQTIRDADHEADLVGQYVASYDATLKQAATKRAMPGGEMGGEEEGEDYSEDEEGDEGGEGGGEMMGGGGGEELPPEILAALAGGGGDEMGGMPGMEGGGEMGGMPPGMEGGLPGMEGGGEMGGMPPGMEGGGEMGGMPPGMEGGGMPGMEGGGMPGMEGGGMPGMEGGGGEDAALQELLMALAEAGISPEQLMGGGKTASTKQECQKLAAAARAYQATGKFRFSEAKTAEQRQLRDYMKNHVLEVARS